MTIGVAFWILPRFRDRARRPPAGPFYAAFLLLNLGIWLVIAGSTLGVKGHWLFAGRVTELLAVALVLVTLWPRIVSRDG